MRLIVLRHAETEYNDKKLMQGMTDIPLSQQGIEHCLDIKKQLLPFQIDFAIASPLRRTKMTASLVTDAPILTDERLIERNLGEYEGKPVTKYDAKKYADIHLNCTEHSVEPILSVVDRVFSLLKDLEKYQDKTILLVTHGGILRTIPYYIQGIPKDGILLAPKLGNGEYIEIIRKEETYENFIR